MAKVIAKGKVEGMKSMLQAIELLKSGHTLEDIEKQTGIQGSLLEKLKN